MTTIFTNMDIEKEIKEAIKKNGGYCPCQLEMTEDTKCMCKSFRDQTEGECHCGLYKKVIVGE